MGETRKSAAILAVASRLFAEKGYPNTPTSEIAREAGVAEGTLYHHFGSKDGIFLSIFNETVDGYIAGVENLIGLGKNGSESLLDLIRHHFDYLHAHEAQFLTILRESPERIGRRKTASAAVRRKKLGRLTGLMTEIMERGSADGSIHLRFSARDTAEMLRGILYGTTRHRMLGIIDVPLPRLKEMLTDFCRQALTSPARGRAERHGGEKH